MSIKFQTRAILRAAPPIIIVASILAFVITGQTLALRFIGYYLVTELLAKELKGITGQLFNDNTEIYRPKGAGGCTGCSPFVKCDSVCVNVDDRVGMPSGHSMGAMMAATFWSLWIWQHGSGGVVSKGIRCGLLIAMALAVVISRTSVIENCHTPLQVIVGSLLGIMLGYGFYFVDLYCIGHK